MIFLEPTNFVPLSFRIFDIIHCENSLFLVFEYLEQDLKIYLDSSKQLLSKQQVKGFLWQLLQALAFCHSHLIIHRDLSSIFFSPRTSPLLLLYRF